MYGRKEGCLSPRTTQASGVGARRMHQRISEWMLQWDVSIETISGSLPEPTAWFGFGKPSLALNARGGTHCTVSCPTQQELSSRWEKGVVLTATETSMFSFLEFNYT